MTVTVTVTVTVTDIYLGPPPDFHLSKTDLVLLQVHGTVLKIRLDLKIRNDLVGHLNDMLTFTAFHGEILI